MGRRAVVHLEILSKRQRELLPKLDFLRKTYGFYLAGGTGLALQIGHRGSVDFDFYTPRGFDPKHLFKTLKGKFPPFSLTHLAEGTLLGVVQNVRVSFFRYAYPLLKPLRRTGFLDLASLEDIAAMKVLAIAQRGTRRDFVDLYFLLKRFELEALLVLSERKYAGFDRYMGLRALTYFKDAEVGEDRSRGRLDLLGRISWGEVKGAVVKAVENYRKQGFFKK